jgi:hypothetical protein
MTTTTTHTKSLTVPALEMDEDTRDLVGWDRSGRARNRPTYADHDRTS